MSRYLHDLVLRSLGQVSGANPRPVTRYETVRQSAAAELTESRQEPSGMNAPLNDEPSFREPLSWFSHPGTDVRFIEDVVERGRQSDASLEREAGSGSIGARRGVQGGISGETIGEDDGIRGTRAVRARRPLDSTRVSGRLSTSLPEGREAPSEGVDGLVAPAPRSNALLPERAEPRADQKAPRPESTSGVRNSQGQPAAEESHPPSGRAQEGLSDALRPTVGELSFQHVRREVTVPPVGARLPVVQIRIGRIEVRAVASPILPPSKKVGEPPRSSMPLDQYLRRRSREA